MRNEDKLHDRSDLESTCPTSVTPAVDPLSPSAQILDLGKRILGQNAFDQLMKLSFYGQFVAGEDHVAIRPLIQKNRAFGVGSVLDYSVEEDISEEQQQQEGRGHKETGYENWLYWMYAVHDIRLLSVASVPWPLSAGRVDGPQQNIQSGALGW